MDASAPGRCSALAGARPAVPAAVVVAARDGAVGGDDVAAVEVAVACAAAGR